MKEKKKCTHEHFTTRFQTHFQERLKNQQLKPKQPNDTTFLQYRHQKSRTKQSKNDTFFAVSKPKIHTQIHISKGENKK